MKIIVCLALSLMIFITAACGGRVKTANHSAKSETANTREVFIAKNLKYSKFDAKVLGKRKAGDSDFSGKCDKEFATETLKSEASALKANVINILLENEPDFYNPCYRVEAEFLYFTDMKLFKPQPEGYGPVEVIGYIAGVAIGYFLGALFF